MARKRKAPAVSRSGGVVVVQSSPPARRSSGSRAPAKRRKSSRRRSSVGGGGSSYSLKARMTGAALGGFGVGFIEKHWGAQLPSLPWVGRKGAIALAAYFFAPKHKLLVDVGIAAAAISGYQFGSSGEISGEDDVLTT